MTPPVTPRRPGPPPTPVTVISFGYGHQDTDGRTLPPPPAHLTIDVRTHFRDPHVNPSLRYLTAADAPVIQAVQLTPGIPALIESMTAPPRAFRAAPRPGPITIAVGCVGGRHRSAVIAAEAARRLDLEGIPVILAHRDIERPVIERRAGGAK